MTGPGAARSPRLAPLIAATAGLALVVAGAARASMPVTTPIPGPSSQAEAIEAQALGLLTVAAQAARNRTYRGLQYVTSWRGATETQQLFDVTHSPESGLVISDPTAADAGRAVPDVTMPLDTLDDRLLGLLAEHYMLSMAPVAPLDGRSASVIEARQPGSGQLAGRFWIDRDSGLLLHREVFDPEGRLVRSSGSASVSVQPRLKTLPRAAAPVAAAPVFTLAAAGERIDEPGLAALKGEGWPVPTSLPDNLDLFDARLRTAAGAPVLHLAYSDGLSTMSLFVQPGRLGRVVTAGFTAHQWSGAQVFVQNGSPMRVVWAGGGRVWTLVSDSPAETITSVVAALPHERPRHRGLLDRLGAGLSRLAGWLNPFG